MLILLQVVGWVSFSIGKAEETSANQASCSAIDPSFCVLLSMSIITMTRSKVKPLGEMPSSSHPSFCVLLDMSIIAMTRSMVKALGEIYFALYYYSFVTSTLFLDSISFGMGLFTVFLSTRQFPLIKFRRCETVAVVCQISKSI